MKNSKISAANTNRFVGELKRVEAARLELQPHNDGKPAGSHLSLTRDAIAEVSRGKPPLELQSASSPGHETDDESDDDDLALEKLDQFRLGLTRLASSADFQSSVAERARRDGMPVAVARHVCRAQLASGLARKLSIGMSRSVQQAIEAALEFELRPLGNTASSAVTSQPAPFMWDLRTWQVPRTVWDCVELFKQRMRAATIAEKHLARAQEARAEQHVDFISEIETGHPGHQALIYLLRFAHEEEHGLAPGASACTVGPTATNPIERSISAFHKLYDRMLQSYPGADDAEPYYKALTAHRISVALSEGMPADVQQAVAKELEAVLASLSGSDERRAIVLGLLDQAIRQPDPPVAFAQAVKAAVNLQREQTQAPVDSLAQAREIYRLFEIQLYGQGHGDLSQPMRAQLDKMDERARQQPAIDHTLAQFDSELKFNLESDVAIETLNLFKRQGSGSSQSVEWTYKANVALSLGPALLRTLQAKGASPVVIHALKSHVDSYLDQLGMPPSVRAGISLDKSLQDPEFTQVVMRPPASVHR